MIFTINQQFNDLYGRQPVLFAAPGRVNLIGEHTDYNEGFVLPGAIDKRIYVGIHKNDTRQMNVFGLQYQEKITLSLDDLQPTKGWTTYLAGMAFHMQKDGHQLGGVDVVVGGDVPVGGGLSSSAALCSAFGFALNELFCLGLSRMQIALLGQRTEHTFAGVKTGIMDQFASLHGKENHVMKLDCRSMEFEYIPFDYQDYKIVLVNTMVSHSLASSEYNTRRQQCEEGVAILKKHYPEIHSLRDVSAGMLDKHKQELPEIIYRRCGYVINENNRLLKGCEVLQHHDLKAFGRLMYQSHEGLSKQYEVSCPELDFLVEQAKDMEGVAGARMMGGGFGGCTINLVNTASIRKFTVLMQQRYENEFGRTPEVYITQIEDGAKLVTSSM
ncbi:MAG TPA: galactokinase [Chitinophagaceae bacterium]|nr:galactokinase [Chitinophagaceae bacterium]